jgi:hypothetical protein
MPLTSGKRAKPRFPAGIARSRTCSDPSLRRTTTANAFGERIITPSSTA